MMSSKNAILEIRNRRHSAVVYINDTKIEVLECSNTTSCKIQGVKGTGCPNYCPFIVDAKRYMQGLRTKFRVEVLSPNT
ncbi:hypothetical protein [Archaeoglobus neptunius]|uniref:hypothetical protein n=1 Tax=Archaeoglobus neptunius TaxID=2798580 RepID=UPI0019262B67|nr:hypothetical protein [Archaeoglobus neptunius]